MIAQWPEVVALLDKLGVKVNEVKSGNLKAVPSPFIPLEDGARQVTQNMVNDGFKWFLSLLETRRGVKTAEVSGLEQGRIFSGREALSVKLVDQIGGEAEAIQWLVDKKGIAKGLKVIDWKPSRDDEWGLSRASTPLGGQLGETATQLLRAFGSGTRLETLTLDGLVSVWHP